MVIFPMPRLTSGSWEMVMLALLLVDGPDDALGPGGLGRGCLA